MELIINKDNQVIIFETLNQLPVAMVIFKDHEVVFANEEALKLSSAGEGDFVGDFIGEHLEYAKFRLNQIQYNNEQSIPREYMLKTREGDHIYIEVTASSIDYFEEKAVIVVAHNITETISDILVTELAQQKKIHIDTLTDNNLLVDILYKPAGHISGDFYLTEKISEDEFIAVVGDVKGKGSLGALMISSFEVMFREAVSKFGNLDSLVETINTKMNKYFEDEYIAVLFVHRSYEKTEFISAGIHEFLIVDESDNVVTYPIKGPYLGMMSSGEKWFESIILDNKRIRKLLMYTDGLDEMIQTQGIDLSMFVNNSTTRFISEISNQMDDYKYKNYRIKDDTLAVAMDFHYNGAVDNYVIHNIEEGYKIAEQLAINFDMKDQYNIRLILSELVTNGFKHGNDGKSKIPIGFRITRKDGNLVIKVTDFAVKKKSMEIPEFLDDETLLFENGRGIFILSTICQALYWDANSVVAEYKFIKED